MIKLVWFVVTLNAQGMPAQFPVAETTEFETMKACEKFGREMTPQLEAWVLGAMRRDWDWPIQAAHKCAPAGDPA